MRNYFVTVGGVDITQRQSKDEAIATAKKEYAKAPEKGTLNIGIGKTKYMNGKYVYNLLPMHSYLN
jgi:uncharacterized membrane protein